MQALFFRDYRKFHGGVLKVWDYFNHTLAAPGWEPWIQFTPRSNWDPSNPWHAAQDRVLQDASHLVPDLFFVAGRDWLQVDKHPSAGRDKPIINLVQHVRHARADTSRFEFLERPAIRICVSDEVADALRTTGIVRGPILTIPNGLDLAALDDIGRDGLAYDLFIVGIKQPQLARDLAARFAQAGHRVCALLEPLPRIEFLRRLAAARIALFLPNETEGFYLPALEGMVLGTLVVCPDCIGNRTFVVDGETGFRPPYDPMAIIAAADAALALDADAVRPLLAAARAMAERYGTDGERTAFHAVLDDLDRLWRSANE